MRGSTNSAAPARGGAGNAGGRFAVALAAAVALLAFAAVQRNAQHAAESGYLALVAAVVLAAVAALPGRRDGARGALEPLPWAAVLTLLAAVALPAGAGRGAGVVALLVAALAAALPAALAAAPRRWLAEVAVLLPAAVAVQTLYRGGELLGAALDRRTLLVFVALPAAAALATAWLAVRHGRGAALVAAALALLVCDGVDATATVVLVALAAGEVVARPPLPPALPPARSTGAARRWAAPLLRAAAAVVLAAPLVAWQPRTAALALAAALVVGGLRPAVWLAGGAAAVACFAVPVAGWEESGGRLVYALLLAPLLPLAVAPALRRPATLLASVAVAVAAARCAAPVEALAAPLALAALVVWGRRPQPGEPPVREPLVVSPAPPGLAAQGAWCALLLAAGALAAAYPWLREEPVRAVLGALRLPTAGWPALLTLLAAAALSTLAILVQTLPARRAAGVAFTVAAALVLLGFARGSLVAPSLLDRQGLHLTVAEPLAEVVLRAPVELAGLVVDGSLSNAAGLGQGTPVATVRLFAPDEASRRTAAGPLAEWTLAAGVEIAEWAAERTDVAPHLAHRMPSPWVSWVSPEGDCFGHTYRGRFDAGRRFEAGRLSVERHRDLPTEVVVHLERLGAAW